MLLVAMAAAQDRDRGRSSPRAQTPNTLRVLNQRLPEVTFQETPFDQVMEWLADFTQLNISVRWQTLEDAGVARDTPITVQARNLRLSQVLWLIMNEAAGSDLKLAYRASGTLLILSTEEDLSREMVTKIYDVADLLLDIPRAVRQMSFDVTQGMGQGGQGGGGGGGGGSGSGMFGQGTQQGGQQGEYGNEQGGAAQMDKLVELIQQTVEPDSWRQYGGRGTIFPFQRSLVVRNTILVHQRLGGYLTEEDVVGR
jgi:hypothetical protein